MCFAAVDPIENTAFCCLGSARSCLKPGAERAGRIRKPVAVTFKGLRGVFSTVKSARDRNRRDRDISQSTMAAVPVVYVTMAAVI